MDKVTLRTLLTVAFTLNCVNYNNTNSGITVYCITAGGIEYKLLYKGVTLIYYIDNLHKIYIYKTNCIF